MHLFIFIWKQCLDGIDNMNKKILIGSIIAVAILIGVSFTSVVGYISVESNVKVSPLFNIRTSRAIDEESKDITCDYIGKGETIAIPLSGRYNKSELLKEFLIYIDRLENNKFYKFLFLGIKKWDNTNKINNNDILMIIDKLKNIKDNPFEIEKQPTTGGCTLLVTVCEWIPFCIPYIIIGIISIYIFAILAKILRLTYMCPW